MGCRYLKVILRCYKKSLKPTGMHTKSSTQAYRVIRPTAGSRRIDWALEGDVKFVILELGANDILRGQPVSKMKKNLDQIIERARARGMSVLLAGMEAPTNAGPEYRKEVHEAYLELAENPDVQFIPFFLDRVAGIQSLNQADGVHPNAEGNRGSYRDCLPRVAPDA